MKLQTQIQLKPADDQIGYESQLLILGSCFAAHIGSKLEYFKFQSLQNPFGMLFHPVAIERLMIKAIKQEIYAEENIFFSNERWHSFDAHSDLSDPSKEKYLERLNSSLGKTNQQITKATHVLITLGTAWVYRKLDTDAVVANCHKVPQNEFSKELLTIEEIKKSLETTIACMQSINKHVRFIFTVSPVRHLKDGFIENQRSKSHLIAAIHQIIASPSYAARISYFESYELMMDELRDYRFYASDMVHPNQVAIDYIWEKFSEVRISPKAHVIMEKVDTIQKGLGHRPFNANSEQHKTFLKSLEAKITYLQQEYPFMKFLD